MKNEQEPKKTWIKKIRDIFDIHSFGDFIKALFILIIAIVLFCNLAYCLGVTFRGIGFILIKLGDLLVYLFSWTKTTGDRNYFLWEN